MALIGFIGMGLMGVPMSKRLLEASHDVWVWNRNSTKCATVVESGGIHANGLEELVKNVDVIMLCVSNTMAVEDIVNQLMPFLKKDQIIIDFSSISPDATRTLSHKVAAVQVNWVDSPVSGGVAGAEAGTLAIMVGGDLACVEAIKPLLEPLSQRVTHMGPVGAGQTTKICNQMIVSCNVLVMAEVLAMAQKSGVDATLIPQALKGGFADSIPLQLTGSRMAEQDFKEVKWHIKTLLKDLDMANKLATQLGCSVPMVELGTQLMHQHGRHGYLEEDPSTLIKLYDTAKNDSGNNEEGNS